MFRNKLQKGYLSILYSCGGSPLEIWSTHVKNGFIRRVTDEEIKSLVLEIAGTNVSTTFISAPKNTKISLGIQFPFLIMILKNMRKYFTFEITVLDDKRMHRRFRISNFQKLIQVKPLSTTIPIFLKGGWIQIQFNLADLLKRAYNANYVETTRMQINANCRIRRIFFTDRLYNEDELPEDYKLTIPLSKCVRASDKRSKDRISKISQDRLSYKSQVPSLTSQHELIEKPSCPLPPILIVEEPPKLDIHVPNANYEEESDEQAEEHGSESEKNLTNEKNKSEGSDEEIEGEYLKEKLNYEEYNIQKSY